MKQQKPRLVSVFLSLIVCLAVAGPVAGQSSAEQVHQRAIADALVEYHTAAEHFERTERLVESGAASQRLLRQHRFEKQMALLAYHELVSPDRETDIARERARIRLELSLDEYEVVRKLYSRSAASELELRRARARLEVDSLQHRCLTDAGDLKMLAYEVALVRFELAEFEFDSAERLVGTGSISQRIFERVADRYLEAERNLESARRNLSGNGATVDLCP